MREKEKALRVFSEREGLRRFLGWFQHSLNFISNLESDKATTTATKETSNISTLISCVSKIIFIYSFVIMITTTFGINRTFYVDKSYNGNIFLYLISGSYFFTLEFNKSLATQSGANGASRMIMWLPRNKLHTFKPFSTISRKINRFFVVNDFLKNQQCLKIRGTWVVVPLAPLAPFSVARASILPGILDGHYKPGWIYQSQTCKVQISLELNCLQFIGSWLATQTRAVAHRRQELLLDY